MFNQSCKKQHPGIAVGLRKQMYLTTMCATYILGYLILYVYLAMQTNLISQGIIKMCVTQVL